MIQPTLYSDRLLLRPLEESDAEPMTELLQEPEIARNLLVLPFPYHLHHAQDFIRLTLASANEGRTLDFAITRREEGRLMGVIGVNLFPEHYKASFGYWVGKPHWGQGYVSEAARRLVDYCFKDLGYNRVEIECYTYNIGSERVMQKAGLSYEGISRQYLYQALTQEFKDVYHYAILRQEYNDPQYIPRGRPIE